VAVDAEKRFGVIRESQEPTELAVMLLTMTVHPGGLLLRLHRSQTTTRVIHSVVLVPYFSRLSIYYQNPLIFSPWVVDSEIENGNVISTVFSFFVCEEEQGFCFDCVFHWMVWC